MTDWREITTTQLHDKGIFINGSTDGFWMILGITAIVLILLNVLKGYDHNG